ncbi:MAG: hypothetical protein H0V08_00925, partial [Thermoleophilaceae bacterium]|nr:hypothetical protein [Thermoleophilaceae bacterium]
DAMIDKPKRKASRLGTFGEVLYAMSPKTVDVILNTAYNLFPDSKASRGKDEQPKELSTGGDGGKEDEMSTEAIAMAYLMKGVHF